MKSEINNLKKWFETYGDNFKAMGKDDVTPLYEKDWNGELKKCFSCDFDAFSPWYKVERPDADKAGCSVTVFTNQNRALDKYEVKEVSWKTPRLEKDYGFMSKIDGHDKRRVFYYATNMFVFRYGTKDRYVEFHIYYYVSTDPGSRCVLISKWKIIRVDNEAAARFKETHELELNKVADILLNCDYDFEGYMQYLCNQMRSLYESFDKECSLPEEIKELSLAGVHVDRNNYGMAMKLYRLWRVFKDTGKVPNLAFLGDAGVGKSKTAKEAAVKLFNVAPDNYRAVTPADLKGAYVGQTKAAIYDIIDSMIQKNLDGQKVIMIDEVYTLFNDQFGEEAASILLPILSGDQTVITRGKEKKEGGVETECPPIDLSEYNFTIWMAGYDFPTKRLFERNLGLFRRMEVLSFRTPTVDRLLEVFDQEVKKKDVDISDSERESVRDFIAWASGCDNSRYFANYAGVEKLAENIVSIRKDCKTPDKAATDDYLKGFKEEIEAQSRTGVLMSKEGKYPELILSPFKSESDLPPVEVIGNSKVKEELDRIALMIYNKEDYLEKGISIPKGMLLVGYPGTGKSHLAKYMARRLQDMYSLNEDKDHRVGFIRVVATQLETEEMVDKLFETAGMYDECVIFIDEIDAIGLRRENNIYASSLYNLMTRMDGFTEAKVFVLAATNAPERLDPALKRPGRFDRVVEIGLPELEDRKALIRTFLEKTAFKNADSSEDSEEARKCLYDKVSRMTNGFSVASIKMIVNNAAIELGQKEVINAPATIKQWEDELIEQIDTYLIGEKKPDDGSKEFDIKENEGASATAIHEVGHALMKITEFGETIPFDEITVVPRGRALGYVKGEGNRERKLTKDSLLKEIRYILGGRAAEEVIYGHDNISAGASEDIASATGIARNMVSKYGMSEEIGPFALIASTGNYLGKCDEYICTAEVRAKAEETQMKIVREQYLLTVNKLKERKEVLIALSHKVFDMKTMSGEDFMGEYERLVNRGDGKGDQ